MKKLLLLFLFLVIILPASLDAQPVHRWHVADYGGGSSTAGGVVLQGSVGNYSSARATGGGATFEAGYIPGVRNLSGVFSSFNLPLVSGWNMISAPFLLHDSAVASLFPFSTSLAYGFGGTYQSTGTLSRGKGYWLKFNADTIVTVFGSLSSDDTISVRPGWNLIGSPSIELPADSVAAVPPVTIVSSLYQYSSAGGYSAAVQTIPGNGYWVKVSGEGRIVFRRIVLKAQESPNRRF